MNPSSPHDDPHEFLTSQYLEQSPLDKFPDYPKPTMATAWLIYRGSLEHPHSSLLSDIIPPA